MVTDEALERDYCHRRAVVERRSAQQAPTEEIERMHLALAVEYDKLAAAEQL
jgi:hypothetical protein